MRNYTHNSTWPQCFAILAVIILWFTAHQHASARELWNKDGIVILLVDGEDCKNDARLEISAANAGIFETRAAHVQSVLLNALATRSFECSELVSADVVGKTNDVVIFQATATRTASWKIRVTPSPLEQKARTIEASVATIDDLKKIVELDQLYDDVPGIQQIFGYFLWSEARKKAIAGVLNENAISEFESSIAAKFKDTGSPKTIRDEVKPTIQTVASFDAKMGRKFQTALDNKLEELAHDDWAAFLDNMLAEGDILDGAFNKINEKLEKLPPPKGFLTRFDNRLAKWAGQEIEVYEALLNTGFISDAVERQKIGSTLAAETISEHLPETKKVIANAITRLQIKVDEDLKSLRTAAQTLIDITGETYLDIMDVVENGLGVASEFKNSGLEEDAKFLVEQTNKRVDLLIDEGLKTLKVELASTDMTKEAIKEFNERSKVLEKLSADYPKFRSYIVAIEDGITAGKQRICKTQAAAAVNNADYLQHRIITGKEPSVSISDLACRLYTNDHILTEYKPTGWISWLFPAALSIDRSDSRSDTYRLSKSEKDGIWFGKALVKDDGLVEINAQEWTEIIDELIIPPPSGKPNARGITECDTLAADPGDKSIATEGVKFEDLPPDYDYDRAIDACIAAIEHDPAKIRFYYQTARVLNFLGAEEEAASLLQTAINTKYPPALYLAAEQSMAKEDDAAFYDAVDYLKLSAAGGYEPAQKLLKELIPPGVDFYRPIPDPTDEQIMAAVWKRKCTPSLLGVQACVYRTGVYSKDCFQTGAKTFSCELRFRFRCDMTGNTLYSGLMSSICGTSEASEPTFETIHLK